MCIVQFIKTLKTTSAYFKFWMWSSYLWNIFIRNCKSVFYYSRKDGHSLKENEIKQNVRALGIQNIFKYEKKTKQKQMNLKSDWFNSWAKQHICDKMRKQPKQK